MNSFVRKHGMKIVLATIVILALSCIIYVVVENTNKGGPPKISNGKVSLGDISISYDTSKYTVSLQDGQEDTCYFGEVNGPTAASISYADTLGSIRIDTIDDFDLWLTNTYGEAAVYSIEAESFYIAVMSHLFSGSPYQGMTSVVTVPKPTAKRQYAYIVNYMYGYEYSTPYDLYHSIIMPIINDEHLSEDIFAAAMQYLNGIIEANVELINNNGNNTASDITIENNKTAEPGELATPQANSEAAETGKTENIADEKK